MKTNQIVGRCILAGLFVYLLIQIFYLSCYILPSAAEDAFEGMICLFLVQSILFAVSIFVILLLLILQSRRRKRTSPFEALVLVSESGKIKEEVLLQDKHSLAITGKKSGKEIFLEGSGEPRPDRYLYGVLNLVSGCWYIEAAPGGRPVGLRREKEGLIYRLREGVPCKLSGTDVIYADTCKIVVRLPKKIWRDGNGSDSL